MNIIKLGAGAAENALQDMIERFENAKQNSDLKNILNDHLKQFGIKNAAYLGYNLGKISDNEPFSAVTYREDWINHYRANNYFEVDPVLKACRKSILPLDWQNLEISTPKVKKFFNEANSAGVGRFGLSIPVRGLNGDFSIFSLTFDESEKDWNEFKRQFIRDFQVLAVYFHKAVLEANNIKPPEFRLSNRELEVLYWAACGKTSEETATILGITKRGVRFHCANIMTKLNTVNIAHTVAKGINYNLINPPK